MSRIERFEVSDQTHGAVRCALLAPPERAVALCLFLYGGGGSRESLADVEPIVSAMWNARALPPIAFATPDVGPWSFYLDDEKRGLAWESFVRTRFIGALRERCPRGPIGIVGVSMGGYGALKIAFSRPDSIAAVAAISPMIEPAIEADDVPPRNRFHYPPEVPSALLGDERDRALYRADHPAARVMENAHRASELAIYIEAASNDALNAHDGAEVLHRTLWDLDLAHEYRLRRDADHIDETMPERLREAFAWIAARLVPREAAPVDDEELAWLAWLEGDRTQAPPPMLPPTSPIFPQLLRALVEPGRREALAIDPTTARRYGVLRPGTRERA
jgi:S-formylglutathione hydrolase